jgi:hypothetical protein
MVEQLFIHKPNIYPFSIIFSLSSPAGVALSLNTSHLAKEGHIKANRSSFGANLSIWSKRADVLCDDMGLLSLILDEKEIRGFGFGQSFPTIRFGGISFPPNQLGVTFLVDNLSLSM